MKALLARVRQQLRRKRVWGALASTLLLGALSIYALAALLRNDPSRLDFRELLADIGPATFLRAFVAGSLVYIGDLALAIIGWGWIMGTLSQVWQWPQHLRIYCITSVTRRLPGTIWYMLGRVMLYERLQVPRSITVIAGGLEFAMIILSGILVTLVTWPLALSGQDIQPAWLALGLALGLALLNPWALRQLISRLSRKREPLDLRYRHLLGWVLLYAAVWCGGGTVLYTLIAVIHQDALAPGMLLTVIGIWSATGLVAAGLAFVPLGFGINELTLTALLSPSLGASESLLVALLMRAVLTINEVLWALVAGALGLLPAWRTSSGEARVETTAPLSDA